MTNNLSCCNRRVRTRATVELAFDLDPNLRSRNRGTNTPYDARQLANGESAQLKQVQLGDHYAIKRLRRVLEFARPAPSEWTLAVELEGHHIFRVRPQFDNTMGSLCLHVDGHESGAAATTAWMLASLPPRA